MAKRVTPRSEAGLARKRGDARRRKKEREREVEKGRKSEKAGEGMWAGLFSRGAGRRGRSACGRAAIPGRSSRAYQTERIERNAAIRSKRFPDDEGTSRKQV